MASVTQNQDESTPIPVKIVNGKKTFTILENNPTVMNTLSTKLGLSPDLEWIDIYSLTDPSLLSFIPRPVYALLAIIPLTPTWNSARQTEDASKPDYSGSGPSEEVIWFKQTIGNACGSIGLLHSLINGPAKSYIEPNSLLERLREQSIPLPMKERAQLLYDSIEFEKAHQSVARMGDTIPPPALEGHAGQHFVSFVVENRKLWELEGDRKGPICRGSVGEEDVLGDKAVELGLGGIIEREGREGGGDLRFSVIALVKRESV